MLEFSNLVFVVYQQMKKKNISSPVGSVAWITQAQSRTENSHVYSAEVVDLELRWFDYYVPKDQFCPLSHVLMYYCQL